MNQLSIGSTGYQESQHQQKEDTQQPPATQHKSPTINFKGGTAKYSPTPKFNSM